MATIDIRHEHNFTIDTVRFSDEDIIVEDGFNLKLLDSLEGHIYLISKDSVDDLIKALQKAKELWIEPNR